MKEPTEAARRKAKAASVSKGGFRTGSVDAQRWRAWKSVITPESA
jgi:hypothetical protein